MSILASFAVLIATAVSRIQCECPNGLREIQPNVCVRETTSGFSYCDAHRICAENYKLDGMHMFLIGKNVKYLKRHPVSTASYFTSVNSLQHCRPSSFDGWRVGDPREANYTTKAAEMPSFVSEGMNNRLVHYHVGRLLIVSQREYYSRVMCQLYPFDYKPSPVEKFQMNWPKEGEVVSIGDPDTGCWSETNANSKIHCAFLCKRNQQCRSSYFNEVTKQCRQSLYVDSSLFVWQIDPSVKWVRFGRPFWGF